MDPEMDLDNTMDPKMDLDNTIDPTMDPKMDLDNTMDSKMDLDNIMDPKMDLDNTLLYDIQRIPGTTPGEKFKFINTIAAEIACQKKDLSEISEALKPLINVEVAKLKNNTDDIVEALKTSNALLCQRALQTLDLFSGENPRLLDWNNFNNDLLSKVSYFTRYKLIKKVSHDLTKKEPKYAEQFYLEIKKQYGLKLAQPLLIACSKDFLNEHVLATGMGLSKKQLEKITAKYADFFVSYYFEYLRKFKLPWPCTHSRKLKKMTEQLINIDLDKFIELFGTKTRSELLYIKLNKRKTKLFMKKFRQKLIDEPFEYKELLTWKVVSSRLTYDEFLSLLVNLFPKEINYFKNYCKTFKKTLTYVTKEKSFSMMTTAFNKKYQKQIFDCPELIDSWIIGLMPKELRVEVARKKLKLDSDWNFDCLENSWRIYLPFDEVFDEIKTQISIEKDARVRQNLVEIMIRNCKINQDKKALLKTMIFASRVLKNETNTMTKMFIISLKRAFNLTQLDQEHWDVIIDTLKRCVTKAKFISRDYTEEPRISVVNIGVVFKLENNLDPDEYLRFYIQLLLLKPPSFDYFQIDNKKHIKAYCDRVFKILPEFLTEDVFEHKILVNTLFNVLTHYNRILKNKEQSIINIEDYPPFIELVEKMLKSVKKYHKHDWYHKIECYVKEYNPDLYSKWIMSLEDFYIPKKPELEFCRLKKNFQEVRDNHVAYYDMALKNLESCDAINFIRQLRWYEDLPIKFVEISANKVRCENDFNAILILGILLDSEKYQHLIDSWIPVKPKWDANDENLKNIENQIGSCLKGMVLTNPPVSLNLIERLLSTDYLPLTKKYLYKTACRTPLPVLIEFISSLKLDRIGLAKRIVELIYILLPNEIQLKVLDGLLDSDKDSLIFHNICKKAWKLFRFDPDDLTWEFFEKCLQKQVIQDEDLLFELGCFEWIPNKYLVRHIELLLSVYEKVNKVGCSDLPRRLVQQLLNQLSETHVMMLPEELVIKLVNKYTFDPLLLLEIPLLDFNFLFKIFLHSSCFNEKRMQIVTSWLTEYLSQNFRKTNANNSHKACRVLNKLINLFVTHSHGEKYEAKIAESFLNTIFSIIKPVEDVTDYINLHCILIFAQQSNFKDRGFSVGSNLIKYVEELDDKYFVVIMDIIKMFLRKVDGNEEESYEFFSGLLEVRNEYNYALAARLLSTLSKNKIDRYNSIIETLKNAEMKIVSILLYNHIYWD